MDGKFEFPLDLETLIKSNIKVGDTLTQKDVDKLINKSAGIIVFNNILRFATLRPRSEKEILDWLRKKKIDEKVQRRVLLKLKRLELVNDEKFTQWWVDQRIQFKSKSMKELVFELRNKGVEKNLIEKVIFESDVNEISSAKKLVQKNWYKWRNLNKIIVRKKISDFLLRKGYSWDTIREILKTETIDA